MTWLLNFLFPCAHRRQSRVFARGEWRWTLCGWRWKRFVQPGQAPDYRVCFNCGAQLDCWTFAESPQEGAEAEAGRRESSAALTRAPAPSARSIADCGMRSAE